MTRKIADYSKTIIYKVICKDNTITNVFYENKNNISKMRYYWKKKLGQNNWDLIEIEKFPCTDKSEATIKVNSINK